MENKVQYSSLLLLLVLILKTADIRSQKEPPPLTDQFRVTFLSPGADYEAKISKTTVLSVGGGITNFVGLEELTGNNTSGDNIWYLITPFVDLQYKLIYNRRKRLAKGKVLAHNAGNYVSLRALWKGPAITTNINRFDNNDFMLGPTWGLQRTYGKVHFLFDIGPVYYFDTIGNSGALIFMIQFNLGLNLRKEQ